MADTLTLHIDSEIAGHLRRAAAESGESLEQFAQRLLKEAAVDHGAPYQSPLTDDQLADLRERLKDPGPIASPAEVESFFARFKA